MSRFDEDHTEHANISAAALATMIDEMNSLNADAARYRWMLEKFQAAYDANDIEINDMVVGCQMLYGCRNERRVQGILHWLDVRDEPLNLSAAIDAAMKV